MKDSPEQFLDKQTAFARDALLTARDGMDRLRAPDRAEFKIAAIALHLTILELTDACLQLAHVRRGTAVPIIGRSIYEASVDLLNLLSDADYFGHMEAANITQILALLDVDETRHLYKKLRPPEDIAAYRTRLEALKAAGKRPLTGYQKAQRINQTEFFCAMYPLLCIDTHGNLAALYERHLVEESDDVVELRAFGETDLELLGFRIYRITEMLVVSVTSIHEAFLTGHAGCLGLRDRLRAANPSLGVGKL